MKFRVLHVHTSLQAIFLQVYIKLRPNNKKIIKPQLINSFSDEITSLILIILLEITLGLIYFSEDNILDQ